jgi:predicted permease
LSRIRLPLPIPIQFVFEPDWRVLTYSAAISIAAALAAGAAPALACVRSGIATALKFDDRQIGAGHSRFRNGLVIAQLAVSVILLAAGFVFLRNLMASASMRPGFDADRTIWAFMRLAPDAYPDASRVNVMAARALEKLRALPGVESATVARVVPLNDNMHITTELTADKAQQPVRAPFHYNYVGEDYFRTMGIRLLAGREFRGSDRGAVILNRNLASRLFGEADPVGRTVRFREGNRLRIAGVVENSKYLTLGETESLAMYEPYGASERELSNLHFLIRARLDPASLVPAINHALTALDSAAALETKPMSRALVFAMLPSRVGAALLGSIGLLGLALASIGLYGALAYAVSRRIREIGLRVALGAAPAGVLALVMRQSAGLVAIGLGAGLAIAALIVRPLAIFLVPEVRPQDPVNFLAVAGILAFVALAATAAPAMRALRVDPLTALRHE